MKDIIVIGAGCAGMTAAIYALRAGRSVLIIEAEGIGGQIAFAPRIENFPSISQISGAEFSNNLFEQVLALGAEIEIDKVVEISANENAHEVRTENNTYKCKSLIIATGLKHRQLGIDRENELSGISYCAICDGAFYKGGEVCVVGGGNSALQSAEFLSAYCKKVYLIHRRSEFRAEEVQLDVLKKCGNIDFVLDSVICSLEGDKDVNAISLENVNSGEKTEIFADGLFVAIGHIPQNDVFKGIINLDEDGYIIAGEDCKTNVEGIFAAGDCRQKDIRQLTTAAADGAVSGLAAARYCKK